jgi:hypothetical protein
VLFLSTYPRKKYKNMEKKNDCGQSYPQQKGRKIKGFSAFLEKVEIF